MHARACAGSLDASFSISVCFFFSSFLRVERSVGRVKGVHCNGRMMDLDFSFLFSGKIEL